LYFAFNIKVLPLAYIKRNNNNNKYKSLTCPIKLKSASIAVLFLHNKGVHSKSLSKLSSLYLYLDSHSRSGGFGEWKRWSGLESIGA
jgi:hypothetical protein